MKVPIEWLKELVNFRAGADQLAQMLTNAGLETVALPDELLEVDVLPNRADCWSIRGIAREVSALTKFRMKSRRSRVNESGKKITTAVRVEVREKELCPRYTARVIENVKVGESPEWLKRMLERVGQRPINNIVDVTNYCLLELGQPLHAFDATLVKDQQILVRRANPEEKIITLDGKEVVLDQETLVIADPEKVIAIAGVMGGANTEVSAATQAIILESAYFQPISIHRTAQALKLRTESSIRFQHGVDWLAVEEALDKGAALIAEIGRGQVLKGKIDICAKQRQPKTLELRLNKVKLTLGASIPTGDITAILKGLGFLVTKGESGKLKVQVPLFRAQDIEREIDLIEEIGRVWGYNRIEATMPNTAFSGKENSPLDRFRQVVRETLVGCGLTEVESYSMLGPRDFANAGLPEDVAVHITNPLTVEESIMRTRVLPGLLKAVVRNQNHQMENVLIFEVGKVFRKTKDIFPEEKWHLGAVISGSPFRSALDKGDVDYYYLKGVVESLFAALGIESPELKETDHHLLQPGRAAEVTGIGFLGILHPDIQRNYELTKPVVMLEFDLEALLVLANKPLHYRPLPKFPSVTRDISMFLPPGVTNQMIVELVRTVGGTLVEEVIPFDRFKESLAYHIIFRSPNKTLTEDEVNRKFQEISQALVAQLAVQIR